MDEKSVSPEKKVIKNLLLSDKWTNLSKVKELKHRFTLTLFPDVQ